MPLEYALMHPKYKQKQQKNQTTKNKTHKIPHKKVDKITQKNITFTYTQKNKESNQ